MYVRESREREGDLPVNGCWGQRKRVLEVGWEGQRQGGGRQSDVGTHYNIHIL